METFIPIWNTLVATGTVVWLAAAIYILFSIITGTSKQSVAWVGKNAPWLAFAIALAAMVGSLVYSEVIGYAACLFCWYQRIVLYPQIVIFGAALFQKRYALLALWQGLVLSAMGVLIGGFHYFFIDIGGKELGACASAGVSCSIRYVFEWGFVTIPLMGLAAALLLFTIALVGIRHHKNEVTL